MPSISYVTSYEGHPGKSEEPEQCETWQIVTSHNHCAGRSVQNPFTANTSQGLFWMSASEHPTTAQIQGSATASWSFRDRVFPENWSWGLGASGEISRKERARARKGCQNMDPRKGLPVTPSQKTLSSAERACINRLMGLDMRFAYMRSKKD